MGNRQTIGNHRTGQQNAAFWRSNATAFPPDEVAQRTGTGGPHAAGQEIVGMEPAPPREWPRGDLQARVIHAARVLNRPLPDGRPPADWRPGPCLRVLLTDMAIAGLCVTALLVRDMAIYPQDDPPERGLLTLHQIATVFVYAIAMLLGGHVVDWLERYCRPDAR